jgi:hypothetical protein
MLKTLARQLFGWGFLLWLFGYALGIVLIPIAGPSAVGWVILPIGVAATWWVIMRKIPGERTAYFALIGVTWMLMAAALDYLFIVRAFHPADGYYKLDVYVYYTLTLALPLAGVARKHRLQARSA